MQGNAPIDLSPAPPREPRFADPLNGEVIVRHIELPADVTFTESGILHQIHLALIEARLVRVLGGNKARCIQLHVHYPETNDQFISHVSEADRAAHG